MSRELYPVGAIVRFHYSWYGRNNPHDGHRCRVLKSEETRAGAANRIYRRYELEDLDWPERPLRGKKIFKMTDIRSSGTTLVRLDR